MNRRPSRSAPTGRTPRTPYAKPAPRPRTAFAARNLADAKSGPSDRDARRSPALPVKPTRAVKRATNAFARENKVMGKNGENLLEKPEWPMRINKYLAQKGYATRKAADELIAKRRVLINGRPAVLGDKVEKTDEVEVRIDKSKPQKKLVYYAFNKPRTVVTHSPQADSDRDILALVPELEEEFGVFPIGRLDKDSHGLILLTNDGRVTDRLLSPTRDHEKEYLVLTKLKLRESFKTHMEEGVNIEGYQTKPAKVKLTGDNSFRITITEGKKHQIRRMVVALFNEVRDLERVRILNIELNKLGSGKYRAIEGEELATFLKTLGL